jgi:hypothetical protein
MVDVPPLEALLPIAIVPVTAPAVVGSNLTVSVAACPGFSVTGKLPESPNPVPLSVAALIVSGAVPEEVSVTDWLTVELRATLPKDTLLVLSVSAGVPAFSCSAYVFVVPFVVPLNVTVCVELTAETVAVKVAVVAPDATMTDAGIATDVLLLLRVTVCPPEPAAADSATPQASVPAPVIVPLLQPSWLSVAAAA